MLMARIGQPRTRFPGYRAEQVLAFATRFYADAGRAPSYREIGNALGINSMGEVRRIVVSLERRGALRRVGSGRVRRIKL